MVCLSGLFASALLVASSWAAPTNEDVQLEKRATTPIAVTGVSGSGIGTRYEIRTLRKNYPDQFNVYIIALKRMQAVEQSDPQSYYQVSGIHGLPMQDWNGVAGDPNTSPPLGYCTHQSTMFLTWHRPYIALYEQILQKHALAVANEFTGSQKTKYVAAARALRAPYWDWAATPSSGNVIPSILTSPTITVTSKSGVRTISNPLYKYSFQGSTSALRYSPFTSWTQTYRYPRSGSGAATSNNDDKLISTFNSQQANLKSRLYNLFTSYPNYMNVSNEMFAGGSGNYDSIESLHDTVHGLVGGGNNGDMSIIDVSAYDPIFWLHHTMIDRFFALWQAVYTNSYVTAAPQKYKTYWYTKGTVLDAGTPLYPFRRDTRGNFHTSNSIRSVSTFGYTYPELGSASTVKTAVNRLYGTSSSSSSKRKRAEPEPESKSESTGILDDITDAVSSAVDSAASVVSEIGSYLGISSNIEYIVNIATDKNAIGGSYFIYVFIGSVPAAVSDWMTSDSLVGIQAVTTQMASAQLDVAMISGTIPLTTFLEGDVESKLLSGLTEALVLPYLQKRLSWQVVDSAGNIVPLSKMSALTVGVVGTKIKKTNSIDEFPAWVDGFTEYTQPTSGKKAGFEEGDKLD